MNTPRLVLLTLPLMGGFFWSCNEPSSPQGSGPPPPPVSPERTPVHLAVGNAYNWRVTQIGFGTFFQWNETSEIGDDTTLDARTYYVFDTHDILSSSGDTVFAYSHDSTSVLYRLNVSVGEIVPFLGYTFRVISVDTQTVLGDTQTVVTVSDGSAPSTIISSGRYASKFGVVGLERRDSLYVTTTSLWGARLGTTTYGSVP